jgi:DNA (cytosine-5)-methyltransferase 1
MSHVDLCSGIGGFALGFEWAGLSKPVLFCDIEPWSRKILAKHWPDVPIVEDVKELASDPVRLVPDCDILTAGYPCQPFSVAGLQRGAEDDRHIWPEIFAIVQAKRPAWCVFENVSGHISLGLNQVLSDLEDKAGYAVQTFCIGAVALNAPHRRQRIFVIAHTDSEGEPDGTKHEQRLERANNVGNCDSSQCCWDIEATEQGGRQQELAARRKNVADTNGEGLQGHLKQQTKPADTFVGCGENVADTNSTRCQEQWWGQPAQSQHEAAKCGDWWSVEPPVGRVANGIPRRVDRLKGLGNAIVPQIAMQIGLCIKAVEDGTNN